MSDAITENFKIIARQLDKLDDALVHVDHRVASVDNQVQQIHTDVDSIDKRLADLTTKFEKYLQRYELATELQLAETKIIKVRQELESKFGHYGEVRRHTTGILQATDVGIIRQDTITQVTEELMLAAPRYWLAPCLVAIACWLADKRSVAEKALDEGLRRDSAKASLFFALVARRMGRGSLSGRWLDRYFELLNPTALDREVVVLIDAVATGVFGVESRSLCASSLHGWLELLSKQPGFQEGLMRQWKAALSSIHVKAEAEPFENLPKYSPTWPKLEAALAGAKVHQAITTKFQTIFDGDAPTSPNVVLAVDDLLDKLVCRFDDEELPLRREERELDLIIEEQGNRPEAIRRADLERDALATQVSFTQLLTNASMHPETSHASLHTQRYATSLSKDWIIAAHEELTAENRASVPAEIELAMEGWSGKTKDGSDESSLVESIRALLDSKMNDEIAKIKVGPLHIVALACGFLALVWAAVTVSNPLWWIIGIAGVAFFFVSRMQMEPNRQKIRDHYAKKQASCQAMIKALCAEVVDWRRAYARADGHANGVREFLEGISSDQYMASSYDSGRVVVNK